MTEKWTKYAVIDLEATNAGIDARIIQIGIVIIENNEITQTFQSDINPHEKLSQHIKSLTGITDQQLEMAPEFSQVAAKIYELIEDCVFVAHNVSFDANLLAEALFFEGYDLLTPRVDTVELAQVFFPDFEKYNLGHLAESMALDLTNAHTAIDDAMATAQLFIRIMKKIASLPKECLQVMQLYADSLIFESGQLISQALDQAESFDSQSFDLVEGILLAKKARPQKPLKLSKDFSINAAILGLDNRPLQNQFANLIQEGLSIPQPSFIQAQAGIGKSYGYLLPLMANSQEDQQILVSVPTKILQDQLMAQEMSRIEEAFHISCHSIKGPSNYLKLDAFFESLKKRDDNRLVNRIKMQLLVWLLESTSGDLDEIKQKHRFISYFDSIRHDGELKKSSPFYDYDFWLNSYEQAKRAKVLLTNHSYFLHRVEDDKAFARDKLLVFDEAQRLLLQLDQLSRKQVNLQELMQGLTTAKEGADTLLEKRLLESLLFELDNLASHYHADQLSDMEITISQQLPQLVKELDAQKFSDLHDFFRYQEADYWISCERRGEKRISYLNTSSQRFINFKSLLPETHKNYFVSATLDISRQVHIAQLLGFDDYCYAKLSKEKSQQQKVIVDTDMPIITEVDDETYSQAIAKRLYLLNQEGKPILVLFHSRKQMLMVSDILDHWHLGHLTQEKNGSPYAIKKRFDRGEQSMLLGMGAFWEGVDFVQADHMIEVISKLPFENPEDLYVKKMSAYLLSQGKNPFNDYFLPFAILKLKQAIGRTMRRQNQKSLVLILDGRILTKSYGDLIFKSLNEDFLISCEKFDDSIQISREFLL